MQRLNKALEIKKSEQKALERVEAEEQAESVDES